MIRGTVRAVIVSMERYEVHGQAAVRLLWRPEGAPDAAPREARLAPESVDGSLAAGDRAAVEVLMGEALEVRRLP